MKILWFTDSSVLYDQGKHPYYGAGWIESLEELVRQRTDIELAVSFFISPGGARVEQKGKIYYPIKRVSGRASPISTIAKNLTGRIEDQKEYLPKLVKIVEQFKPDIIQVFGTEGIWGSIQGCTNVPVAIHLQGLINPYYNVYYPPGFNKFSFLFSRRYLLKNLLGHSPVFSCKKFRNQARREQKYFSRVLQNGLLYRLCEERTK